MADAPVWGEKIDAGDLALRTGIQDVALANVNWSFITERYFGKDCHQVRATRILESRVDWLPGVLLPEPREVEAPKSNNAVDQEDEPTGMVESSAPKVL
ncbi:uncharacterized protein L3040_008437 [Drepanopeziza brunnea f. sp. 'multigermtubi']|nr:hypothetical protein L3040_008437 [Drepanopeziza brunnea f. sp. 'multigermtubi']